ncbi:DsbC family protein [Comamonas jiangduensis]|uniref:DsbC family protein n=1 Tax=Comamonas jiangduensis TaxID=1194168 RepID=UPI003BF8B41F
MNRSIPKTLFTAISSLVLLSAAQVASAQSGVPPQLKANIEAHTQGTVRVDGVAPTPIPGVFQITSESEVFYSDATGRYAFVGGALMDVKNKADLTAPVLTKLNSISWDSLPLKHAIKEVHGNGRKKVAVFEDPLCPICRSFTKFLDQLDDTTVYRFPFPVIDPKSAAIAGSAWCSPNRAEAWKSVMNGQAVNAPQTCDVSGIATILQFGEKHNIQNTPTVVLANGKRLVGATPPEQFLTELDAATAGRK